MDTNGPALDLYLDCHTAYFGNIIKECSLDYVDFDIKTSNFAMKGNIQLCEN